MAAVASVRPVANLTISFNQTSSGIMTIPPALAPVRATVSGVALRSPYQASTVELIGFEFRQAQPVATV
ncbi:hypothetical protein [Candidatus Poriferisodalis sp.]|uniref:hypothetical protein n=1 Tax=Candidatus Poriferisodalis sp. TaxID=3101277 RepID=UPI003C6F18B3